MDIQTIDIDLDIKAIDLKAIVIDWTEIRIDITYMLIFKFILVDKK